MNIILGLTGSVACIKAEDLYKGLSELGEVKIVATESALKFINKFTASYNNLPTTKKLTTTFTIKCNKYTDKTEWNWNNIGDPVQHIELAKWLDVLVIAPLTANTLAKLANGICDNLLTCIYRALPEDKKVILCPAMNTQMWNNKITQRQLYDLINNRTFFTELNTDLTPNVHNMLKVINPISKKLACGDTGIGAMAEVETIVDTVKNYINL